jgi:hypothetical protein
MDDDALVRAELEQHRLEARRTVRRGLVLAGMVPLTTLVALGIAMAAGPSAVMVVALVCGSLYAIFGALFGFGMVTSGTLESRRISKLIAFHDARRQLPVARVVIRD